MTSTTSTSAGRIARGLGSFLLLTILLVGIPIGLWLFAGSPIPESLPSWARIQSTLASPDVTGTVLIGIIKYAGWIAWAGFLIAVLVEIPAAVRGIRAPRLKGLGAQQRAAAALIGAVVAMLSIGPIAATAVPSYAAVPTATDTVATATIAEHAPTAAPTTTTKADESPAPSTLQTYTVQPGDSLWGIAERTLGDGTRYKEIAELNYGVPQPGGYSLDSSHWIDPGWTLTLPIETPTSDPVEEGQQEHVVQPGESLYTIAEDLLGNGDRYVELFEASRTIVQPDGATLTDPGLIRPGWTIALPAAHDAAPVAKTTPAPEEAPAPAEAAEPTPQPAPATPEAEIDETAPEPKQDVAPPDAVTEPGPAAAAGHDEAQAADNAPPTEAPTTAPIDATSDATAALDAPAQSTDDVDDTEDTPVWDAARTPAGIGAFLAAGILSLLTVKRATARRRRRTGERIAMPIPATGPSALEAELRAVADPLGRDTINTALRSLATWHREHDLVLPDVRAARLAPGAYFELYLDTPADLPEPWVSTAERQVWQLSAEDAASLPDDPDGEAPYPSLVTLGHDEENAHFMLDLEKLGCLDIRGSEDGGRATLAALAIELATSPWADDLQVTLVGTHQDLAGVIDTGRIRHVSGFENVARELTRRAEHTEAMLADLGADSIVDARSRGLVTDAWTPEILLIGERLDPAVRDVLDQLVARVPGVGIAAVTNDGDLGEWVLDLDADDTTRGVLHPAEITIRPQQLDADTYEHALELLRDTEPEPGPAWGRNLAVLDDAEPTLTDLEPQPVAVVESDPAAVPALTLVDGDEDHGDSVVEHDADPTPATIADDVDQEETAAVIATLRPPYLRILGPVELDVASGVTMRSSHITTSTELVAYLALHPGATGTQISAAIWPHLEENSKTRRSAISRARSWLGVDEDGAQYLPSVTDHVGDGYRLAGVATDWHAFLELVGDDVTTTPLPRLVDALQLVRGRAFENAPSRRYVWAESTMQEITEAVVDVAHAVAHRALTAGDTATARFASSVGRLVDPADERVWRDGIRAEWADGHPEAITRLVDQLQGHLAALELDPDPETEHLLTEVRDLTDRRARLADRQGA